MNHVLHEYWAILSDPAHLMVELTLMLLIDVLLLGVLFPLFKRIVMHSIKKEHAVIDAEHGFNHDHSEPSSPKRPPSGNLGLSVPRNNRR